MKALVTGATGFIGGTLAADLLRRGWEVSALVRPGSTSRLPPGLEQVIEADLGQLNAGASSSKRANHPLRRALAGYDVLFHAAAIRNRWGASPADYARVNVEGTRRLLEAAAGRVRRFVYLSSVGVAGYPGVLGIDETFPTLPAPRQLDYHASKVAAEKLVLSSAGELDPIVIRPTITYGPGDWDGMLTRLAVLVRRGRFASIGRGQNHLHLTYITDLVEGLVQAATHQAAPSRVFILAGPQSISVRDLLALLDQKPGARRPLVSIPELAVRPLAWGMEAAFHAGSRLGLDFFKRQPPLTRDRLDILCRHRSFSDAKARRLLGYDPKVDYAEGIEKTLEWMSAVGLLLPSSPAGSGAVSARRVIG